MRKPRPFRSLFFASWMGWGAAILVLPMLVIGTLYYFSARETNRLSAEGGDAVAVVVSKDILISRDSDGDRVRTYNVVYRFAVDGQTYDDDEDVTKSFYNSMTVGDEIPMRYWTKDPNVSEITVGGSAFVTKVFMIVGLIHVGLVLLFGFGAFRRAKGLAYLRDHGYRREFTVREVRDTNVKINHRRMYRIVWNESDGREGASFLHRERDLPTEGSEIIVLIDPDGRLPSVWENDVTRG